MCTLTILSAHVFGQCTPTNLSGNQVISSNTTWTSGTYNISGDFTVNSGVTLTISYNNGCPLIINAQNITIQGTINANGAGARGGAGATGGSSSGGAGGGSQACGGAGGSIGGGTGGGTAGSTGSCATGGCSIGCGTFCAGGNDADRAGAGGGSGGAGGSHGGLGGNGGSGAAGRLENEPGNSGCGSVPVAGAGATGHAAAAAWGFTADATDLDIGSGGGGAGGGGGGFNAGTAGSAGGNGGGAVNLNASGNLSVTGSITANGTAGGVGGNGGVRSGGAVNWNCDNCGNSSGGGQSNCRDASQCGVCTYYTWAWPGGAGGGAGGGSGGSIKLQATGTFYLTGSLQANGGDGGNSGHPTFADASCNNYAQGGGAGGGGVIKYVYNPCAINTFSPTQASVTAGNPGFGTDANRSTNTGASGSVLNQTLNIYYPGYTPISAVTTGADQILCGPGNFANDISISPAVTGADGNYSYQWYYAHNSNGQTGSAPLPAPGWTQILNSGTTLSSGTMGAINGSTYYQVQVFSGQCVAWSNVTSVIVDFLPTISNVSATNVLCGNGINNGTITVNATDGIPGYMYSNDGGSTYQADSVFSSLGVGNYNIKVKDSGGCVTTYQSNPVHISAPSPVTISGTEVDASCSTLANGSINLTGGGGVTPYLFNLNAGVNQSSAQFNNLYSGSYTAEITDNNGCTKTTTIVINDSSVLIPSIDSLNNVSCHGTNDGSVALHVTGGVAPYTYSLDSVNFQSSPIFTTLVSGNYGALLKDSRGCYVGEPVYIGPAGALNIQVLSLVNIPCNNAPVGEINILPSGGAAPYTYIWNTSSTSQNLSGLSVAGNYSVTTTDNGGCTGSAVISLQNYPSPSATVSSTDVTGCSGSANGKAWLTGITGGTTPYSINWSNGSTNDTIYNITGGTYVVTVTDLNYCQSIDTVTINQPDAVVLGLSIQPISCATSNDGSATVTATGGAGGFTYAWSNNTSNATVSGLAAGSYSVTIHDANSCTADSSFTLTAPAVLITSATSTNILCAGDQNGTGTVTATGGAGGYTYMWSNSETTATVNDFGVGSFTVTVTDSHGCTSTSGVAISQPTALSISTASTAATTGQSNGTAYISNASGGTLPYSVSWSNGENSTLINNVAAGTYTVTVTDANGCTQTASAVVNQVTGINQVIEEIPFTVYPNPAKAQITVEIADMPKEAVLTIKNVLGKVEHIRGISALQTQIDLSSFASGVYFVELRQGDKMSVKEIVISK